MILVSNNWKGNFSIFWCIATCAAILTVYGTRTHLEPSILLREESECYHVFSLVTVELTKRYVDLICSLLKPQGRILMCAYVYNQSERSSKATICLVLYTLRMLIVPPFSISTDTLKLHYGKLCVISLSWATYPIRNDMNTITIILQFI